MEPIGNNDGTTPTTLLRRCGGFREFYPGRRAMPYRSAFVEPADHQVGKRTWYAAFGTVGTEGSTHRCRSFVLRTSRSNFGRSGRSAATGIRSSQWTRGD